MLLGARPFLFSRIKLTPFELPYDSEVEYLESSGTLWIDTGVLPTFNMKVEVTFILRNNTSTIFGSREGDNVNSFAITYFTNENHQSLYSAQFGNSEANRLVDVIRSTSIKYIKAVYSKDGLFLNDEKVVEFVDPQEFTPYGTIYLFARNDPSLTKGKVRITKFKIFDNGVVIRDYIPVRCGTTGYMYDLVTHTLAENHGEFAIGNDIQPVEYVFANGNGHFKSDILVTDDTAVEIDFMHTALDTTFRTPCGVRDSDGASNSFVINGASKTLTSWAYSSDKYEEFPTNEINHKYHAVLRRGYAAIDEYSTNNMNSQLISSSLCLAIFGRNNNGSLGNLFKGNIYDIKIYKNNILTNRLVPISVLSETPYGALYDVMHNYTYTSTSINNMISGPAINKKLSELY